MTDEEVKEIDKRIIGYLINILVSIITTITILELFF